MLDRLLTALWPLDPRRAADRRAVAASLNALPRGTDWLQAYLRWSPGQYTRNLIYGTGAFELLCVCWDVGSHSAVHDHAGQYCWMRGCAGRIDVQGYDGPAAQGRPGSLRPAGPPRPLRCGELDLCAPRRNVHAVHQVGSAPAISLHLYAQPIRECGVWSPAGRWQPHRCTYDSTPASRAAAAPTACAAPV